MINFTQEGFKLKIGLNLYRSRGGFVALWLWYDVARRELHGWRFRVRLHMRPWLLWSRMRSNVIEDYLQLHELELVNRETLADAKAAEDPAKRRNDRFAVIKP